MTADPVAPPGSDTAVQADALVKRFGQTTALGGVVVWQQRRRMCELCGEAIAVKTFAEYWLK